MTAAQLTVFARDVVIVLCRTAKETGFKNIMPEHGTFIENLEILDEWEVPHEKYRLVNLGAGPDQVQEFVDGEWKKVSSCYQWGIVTRRIVEIKTGQ